MPKPMNCYKLLFDQIKDLGFSLLSNLNGQLWNQICYTNNKNWSNNICFCFSWQIFYRFCKTRVKVGRGRAVNWWRLISIEAGWREETEGRAVWAELMGCQICAAYPHFLFSFFPLQCLSAAHVLCCLFFSFLRELFPLWEECQVPISMRFSLFCFVF